MIRDRDGVFSFDLVKQPDGTPVRNLYRIGRNNGPNYVLTDGFESYVTKTFSITIDRDGQINWLPKTDDIELTGEMKRKGYAWFVL